MYLLLFCYRVWEWEGGGLMYILQMGETFKKSLKSEKYVLFFDGTLGRVGFGDG